MANQSVRRLYAVHDRCHNLRGDLNHIAHHGTRRTIQSAKDLLPIYANSSHMSHCGGIIFYCVLSRGDELDVE